MAMGCTLHDQLATVRERLMAEEFPRHFLSVGDLDRRQIEALFDVATALERAEPGRIGTLLRGRQVAMLFYQPSTRTRVSFEAAAQRLGATATGFADAATTRAGDFYQETLEDIVQTYAQIADCLVLRHHQTGAPRKVAALSAVPLINAGDGYGEHPSQALGDMLTVSRAIGGLDGARIGLVGDASIRSLRAVSILLSRFALDRIVYLPAPGSVIPAEISTLLRESSIRFDVYDDVADVLRDCHAVQTIGIRHPDHELRRDDSHDPNELTPERFRIDRAKIERVNPCVFVIHPGARKDELATDIDTMPNALHFAGVRMNVWIRAALLLRLLGNRDLADPRGPGKASPSASSVTPSGHTI